MDTIHNSVSEFLYTSDGDFASLCADWTYQTYNEELYFTEDGEYVPSDESTHEFVWALMKPRLELDNMRFFFRPLDCSYTDSFFISKERYGDPLLFDELCVNFTKGDPKPEIRVANTYTYFNISNYAYFENITFTGEDLFASL